MNGKRYFNEIKNKYAYINYFQSCIIIFLQNFRGSVLQRDLNEADHLQSQAFHFVFCHSNLFTPILHL